MEGVSHNRGKRAPGDRCCLIGKLIKARREGLSVIVDTKKLRRLPIDMSVSSAMQDGDPLVINHERRLHLPPAHIKIQETNEATPRERDKKCQQKTTEKKWILTVSKCQYDARS